ncbi:CAP domain-containing protein, partial [Massariosphaeria phaeospora]
QQQLEEAPAQYTDDAAFRKTVLDVSNTYRRQHNATRLRWNESLAEYAREWSAGCVFEHSDGPHGENLASGYPNASAAILAWGHERTTYDFRSGDFSRETGHFTQLVWKATTSMGCGRTQCDGRGGVSRGGAPGWYLVCSYHPRGNMLGAFVDNVQPRIPDDEQEQQQPDEGPDSPEVP